MCALALAYPAAEQWSKLSISRGDNVLATHSANAQVTNLPSICATKISRGADKYRTKNGKRRSGGS